MEFFSSYNPARYETSPAGPVLLLFRISRKSKKIINLCDLRASVVIQFYYL